MRSWCYKNKQSYTTLSYAWQKHKEDKLFALRNGSKHCRGRKSDFSLCALPNSLHKKNFNKFFNKNFLNKNFSFSQEKDLTYYELLNCLLCLVHSYSFPWNSVIKKHPIIPHKENLRQQTCPGWGGESSRWGKKLKAAYTTWRLAVSEARATPSQPGTVQFNCSVSLLVSS